MLADRFGPATGHLRRHAVHCRGFWPSAGLATTGMVTWPTACWVGVGIALVYTPAIACVQPWFTRRRGLAAGMASAGIGAGTLLVPLLAAA
jgi:MFS family permease